jgi:hypothetical protein
MPQHLVPVRFRDAAAFVAMWHRHHQPPVGMIFAVGAADDTGVLHGVAIAGRPVARLLDNGQTLEVTRVATDGTRNTCSLLYGACRRAAFSLGYTRLITYTQAGESGASLRAAGWQVIAQRPAHPGWDRPSRSRHHTGTDATQPPPRPWAALRRANRRRHDPDATEHPPRRPHGHTQPTQHRSSPCTAKTDS